MKILVTGTAGFIGFHMARALLEHGETVIGFDNFNDYYDVSLKEARNAILQEYPGFTIVRGNLADLAAVQKLFSAHEPQKVCHLAAQAGVRYSLINPHVYVQSNVEGFLNMIHTAKEHGVENFVYASSSSVYGKNQKVPFSVSDPVDHPVSLYAATKKTDELIAHTYHHLYNMRVTGLRFFTVYGPWGRPDMAYFKFAKAIAEGQPIDVYNNGDMWRDFTYIDDIVAGVIAAIEKNHDHAVFNLGNHCPERLEDLIGLIEENLEMRAVKNYLPMQPGDVYKTYADIEISRKELGFYPKTALREGIKNFIDWYKNFYHVKSGLCRMISNVPSSFPSATKKGMSARCTKSVSKS